MAPQKRRRATAKRPNKHSNAKGKHQKQQQQQGPAIQLLPDPARDPDAIKLGTLTFPVKAATGFTIASLKSRLKRHGVVADRPHGHSALSSLSASSGLLPPFLDLSNLCEVSDFGNAAFKAPRCLCVSDPAIDTVLGEGPGGKLATRIRRLHVLSCGQRLATLLIELPATLKASDAATSILQQAAQQHQAARRLERQQQKQQKQKREAAAAAAAAGGGGAGAAAAAAAAGSAGASAGGGGAAAAGSAGASAGAGGASAGAAAGSAGASAGAAAAAAGGAGPSTGGGAAAGAAAAAAGGGTSGAGEEDQEEEEDEQLSFAESHLLTYCGDVGTLTGGHCRLSSVEASTQLNDTFFSNNQLLVLLLPELWDCTFAAFLRLQQDEASSGVDNKAAAQHVSNVLLACAKLRKQPAAEDLRLLLQIVLQRNVLAAADAQNVANTAWALSQLHQQRGWQGGVSEQDLQQLLGEEQLLHVQGKPQDVANVLLALGRLATGSAPVVSLSFAQAAAKQLLAGAVQQRLRGWNAQDITNSMWACAALKLPDEQFVSAAVAAAPQWLPSSTGPAITQAEFAAVELQLRDESFVEQLLVRAKQLAAQPPPSQRRGSKQARSTDQRDKDIASSGATCSGMVARLDMQRLAPAARELIAASGIGQLPSVHPSSLRQLWVFHAWLLQHQLLDGKGLPGLLTQQQLQQGAKEAAKFGDR